jgi:hypothetical protein
VCADVRARLTSVGADTIRRRDSETARRRILRQVDALFGDADGGAPRDGIRILLNPERKRRVALTLT